MHCCQVLRIKSPSAIARIDVRGLCSYEKEGLEEVGKAVGLTRERVRQIEHEALERLAESLNAG